jgi:phosphatidylglycerol:prolipoprotein diacylglycerol transferase
MLPYVIVPPIQLGLLTIQPFGLLVALGVALTWTLVARRARWLGFINENVQSFLWWMVIGGFIGAHVFEMVLYRPQEVIDEPLTLFMLWKGISSFGGFGGATLGGLAWKYFTLDYRKREGLLGRFRLPVRRAEPMPLLPYADTMIAAFPIAWIFGRTGCAISHDHPGALATSSSHFAVAYGPGKLVDYGFFQLSYGNAPRYDLGLLELLFTFAIAAAFVATWRRGGAKGYYCAAASIVYAPIRFFLDFLRAPAIDGGDVRYALLTPAQWACVVLLGYGFWLLHFIRHTKSAEVPFDRMP